MVYTLNQHLSHFKIRAGGCWQNIQIAVFRLLDYYIVIIIRLQL